MSESESDLGLGGRSWERFDEKGNVVQERTITVHSGPYATVRAIEAAQAMWGPGASVNGVTKDTLHTITYRVVVFEGSSGGRDTAEFTKSVAEALEQWRRAEDVLREWRFAGWGVDRESESGKTRTKLEENAARAFNSLIHESLMAQGIMR